MNGPNIAYWPGQTQFNMFQPHDNAMRPKSPNYMVSPYFAPPIPSSVYQQTAASGYFPQPQQSFMQRPPQNLPQQTLPPQTLLPQFPQNWLPQQFHQPQVQHPPGNAPAPKTQLKATAPAYVPSNTNMFIESANPQTSMASPPGINLIVQQQPPTRKRERKPVTIFNPATGNAVDVNNDSGYPSAASTPNSNHQMPSFNPTPPPLAALPVEVKPAEPLVISDPTPTPETLTPESPNVVDPTPTQPEEAAEEEEQVEETEPEVVLEPQVPLVASQSQTEITNFFQSALSLPKVPSSPASSVKRKQSSDSSDAFEGSDTKENQPEAPRMKRTYSKDELLGLKNNGYSRLPAHIRIPAEIAIQMSPVKRMFGAQTPAEMIFRELRGTLNKMTGENFEMMLGRIFTLLTNENDERMKLVEDKPKLFADFVGVIFGKAISEPKLAPLYAEMFHSLSKIQYPGCENKDVSFRRTMLNYCQQEFEEHDHGNARQAELERELANAVTDFEKKDADENLQEFANVQKAKYLGNIAFIGELYKNHHLPCSIIKYCIERLLSDTGEESLESLCKLLRKVGRQFEDEAKSASDKTLFKWWRQECLAQLHRLVSENSHVSSRIRFFITDVLTARQNGWNFDKKN